MNHHPEALGQNSRAMRDTAARWDKNTNTAEDLKDVGRDLRARMDTLGGRILAINTAIKVSDAHDDGRGSRTDRLPDLQVRPRGYSCLDVRRSAYPWFLRFRV